MTIRNKFDYEKTMETMKVGDIWVIPTSDNDIQNIRSQVSRVSKKLEGMTFSVNKTINGASVTRIQ